MKVFTDDVSSKSSRLQVVKLVVILNGLAPEAWVAIANGNCTRAPEAKRVHVCRRGRCPSWISRRVRVSFGKERSVPRLHLRSQFRLSGSRARNGTELWKCRSAPQNKRSAGKKQTYDNLDIVLMAYYAVLSTVRHLIIACVGRANDIHPNVDIATVLHVISGECPRCAFPDVIGAYLLELGSGIGDLLSRTSGNGVLPRRHELLGARGTESTVNDAL